MRLVSAVLRVVLAAVGLGVGASWWFVESFGVGIGPLGLFWFLIAASAIEPLRIRQPGGLPVATSLSVLGAAAILGASPAEVAGIGCVAWIVGHLVQRRPLEPAALLGRALGLWTLAGLAGLGAMIVPLVWVGDGSTVPASLPVGAAAAVGLAIVVGLPAAETLARTAGRRQHSLRRSREAVVATRLVGPAVAATAGLGALVYPVLGIWTLPTMLIPLLAARLGLERLFVADRAYEQTIRAMSRLPEQFDDSADGVIAADHGVRVGELAGEVAMQLGLSERKTTEVVRAAHLHEMGRLGVEPDEPSTRRQLAAAGARVVRQVSTHLEREATIVQAHGDLSGSLATSDDVRIAARIVAACCELDRYSPDPIDPGQRDEVVVRLVRDVGDLNVISALLQVLERRALEA